MFTERRSHESSRDFRVGRIHLLRAHHVCSWALEFSLNHVVVQCSSSGTLTDTPSSKTRKPCYLPLKSFQRLKKTTVANYG
jgi:hypothetical protein